MIEKREHSRQAVDLEAWVTIDGTSEAVPGNVRDLSIGGMFFVGEGDPAFGTKVSVSIAFPHPSGTLEFPAIVRWAGEDGFGLQFGLVGAKETHAIAKILSKRADPDSS